MKSVKPASSLEEGAKYMIEAMVDDYNDVGYTTKKVDTPDNYKVTEGRKYMKVIRENSVTAFIAKEDFKHFKKGDVLKASSWNAPALNRARGNIFDGMYPIEWTGPLYLN
tara:strand:+ start:146 stop:475 length:330 start_codon:yes stop_codon:yes gene_type:complete